MWIWYRYCLKTMNLRGLNQLWRIGRLRFWEEVTRGFFDTGLKHGGIWHLWGHSWEIEEYNPWGELRKVLDIVSRRQDVIYLTNGEVVKAMFWSIQKSG